MKYNLPEIAEEGDCPTFDLIVECEEGEDTEDVMVALACAAIKQGGKSMELGTGWFDPRIDEELITSEDVQLLYEAAKDGRISLDHWKGRSVKFFIEKEASRRIRMPIIAWIDQYIFWHDYSILPVKGIRYLQEWVLEPAKKLLSEGRSSFTDSSHHYLYGKN